MKIIAKQIVVVLITLIGLQSYSQQEPLYTQYQNNFNLINPAYSGSNGHFTAAANIRSQWAGEANSPETQAFSMQTGLGKNVGVGLSVILDKAFILNNTDIYADFSYALQVSEGKTLSFGLKAGGSFLNVNLLELGIYDDPLLNENIDQFNPNLGVGMYYFTDKFYASVSTVNILETVHYDINGSSSKASDNMVFYLSSGYIFDIGNDFELRPSFLMRGVNGSPLSTDISVSILWSNTLEFGVSHRLDESISGLFQVRVSDHVKVGYSYDSLVDNTIGESIRGGSHEISLVFDFGMQRNQGKQKTPFFW